MGFSISPVLANIFMEFFESMFLPEWLIPGSNWFRYVDHTFVALDETDIESLVDNLNNWIPSIKFTFETETNNRISFLDIYIKRNN